MPRKGTRIAALDEHMVVKLPLTRNGIQACKTLSDEGIRVNVTLVFSTAQACSRQRPVPPMSARLSDASTTSVQRHGS